MKTAKGDGIIGGRISTTKAVSLFLHACEGDYLRFFHVCSFILGKEEESFFWILSLRPNTLHETNIIGTQNLFPNLDGKIIPEFSKSGDALSLYVKILIEALRFTKARY